MATRDVDVLVIGGGPAGSTVSAYLAMKGWKVRLFEKEKFPREHVGESLLPFCYTLFDELGVLDEMKRRFVRKPGVRFIDSDNIRSTNWCYKHVIEDDRIYSFHVIRSEFDQMLLENARRLGVEAREETAATAVTFGDGGGCELTVTDRFGGTTKHRARFLVDASGRDTFMASKMKWRKPRDGFDRTALWSHFSNVRLFGGIEEGLAVIAYVGGEKRGWIWAFALGPERATVGVVMDNPYIRAQKEMLIARGSTDWKLDLFRQELACSSYVTELLANASMTMPLLVNADYAFSVETKYGASFALIGDAQGFIDPIFSSGVFLSMKSAQLVADALDETFSGRAQGDALAKAYDSIIGAYGLVHNMIHMYYNPHAINWAQVGSAKEVLHTRYESAAAAGHYMLAGDFFTNHKKYNDFLGWLQDPANFKRYKSKVIDRSQYQVPSCEPDPNIVFHPKLVAEHEKRRARDDVDRREHAIGEPWTKVTGVR